MKHHPCQQDCRVSFSPLFSIINMIISSIGLASVMAYVQSANDVPDVEVNLLFLTFLVLGSVFSLMVIFYDNIFCRCCGCCLEAEERMVYDPNHPEAELLWRDGQVKKLP